MLFSIMTVLIYLPTNSAPVFPLLHVLANTLFYFIFLLLSCMSSLYILDINPL